jgi:hypothetical protein
MYHHYVYYSFENWGRGYIGSRTCSCLPEEDTEYFGSFTDKTFCPTNKIILGVYPSKEEAIQAEISLHDFYCVHTNPHFANKAKQTSRKFYNNLTDTQRSEQSERVTQTNLRESNVFRKKGEESMSYGRIWVTNEDRTDEIYLKPGEEVPEGWIKGRKFRPRDAESRQRTSRALKGKPKSEQAKKNARIARLAYLERVRSSTKS